MSKRKYVKRIDQLDRNKHFWLKMRPMSRYVVPITISTDDPMWVECTIDESHYKLKENSKIELRAILDEIYGKEIFYADDFLSKLNKGEIVEADGIIEPKYYRYREHLCGNAYIECEGYILQ